MQLNTSIFQGTGLFDHDPVTGEYDIPCSIKNLILFYLQDYKKTLKHHLNTSSLPFPKTLHQNKVEEYKLQN